MVDPKSLPGWLNLGGLAASILREGLDTAPRNFQPNATGFSRESKGKQVLQIIA